MKEQHVIYYMANRDDLYQQAIEAGFRGIQAYLDYLIEKDGRERSSEVEDDLITQFLLMHDGAAYDEVLNNVPEEELKYAIFHAKQLYPGEGRAHWTQQNYDMWERRYANADLFDDFIDLYRDELTPEDETVLSAVPRQKLLDFIHSYKHATDFAFTSIEAERQLEEWAELYGEDENESQPGI